jgi:uncharacterized sodium:solute symporter family permease YidK
MGLVVIVPHVIHRAAVAFAETFAVVLASLSSLDGRVFVHFVVISIMVASFAHVVPSGFNALVETSALRIALVVSGRLIPVVMVLGEGCAGDRLCFKRVRLEGACGCDAESKQGWSNPAKFFHRVGTSSFKA